MLFQPLSAGPPQLDGDREEHMACPVTERHSWRICGEIEGGATSRRMLQPRKRSLAVPQNGSPAPACRRSSCVIGELNRDVLLNVTDTTGEPHRHVRCFQN